MWRSLRGRQLEGPPHSFMSFNSWSSNSFTGTSCKIREMPPWASRRGRGKLTTLKYTRGLCSTLQGLTSRGILLAVLIPVGFYQSLAGLEEAKQNFSTGSLKDRGLIRSLLNASPPPRYHCITKIQFTTVPFTQHVMLAFQRRQQSTEYIERQNVIWRGRPSINTRHHRDVGIIRPWI